MAGHHANWFRPKGGRFAGKAIYLSKAQQQQIVQLGGYPAFDSKRMRAYVQTVGLSLDPVDGNPSGLAHQFANTQRPAGAAKPRSAASVSAPSTAPATFSWYPDGVTPPPFPVKPYKGIKEKVAALTQAVQGQLKKIGKVGLESLKEYQDGLDGTMSYRRAGKTGFRVGFYQPINRYLRGIAEPDFYFRSPAGQRKVQRTAQAIERAIDKSAVPEDIVTFRVIRAKGGRNPGQFKRDHDTFVRRVYDTWKEGDVYKNGSAMTDQGFTSTGLNFKQITKWMNDTSPKENVMIEFRVPKGTKGVFMDAVNPGAHYQFPELLLQRKLGFRVVKKWSDGKGKRRAILEILPPNEQ
jgi:hypothetical protein